MWDWMRAQHTHTPYYSRPIDHNHIHRLYWSAGGATVMDASWPAASQTHPQDNGGDINICIVSVERSAARQWLTCGSLFICSRGASAARSLNASTKLYSSTQTGALPGPRRSFPGCERLSAPLLQHLHPPTTRCSCPAGVWAAAARVLMVYSG